MLVFFRVRFWFYLLSFVVMGGFGSIVCICVGVGDLNLGRCVCVIVFVYGVIFVVL